MGMAWSSPKAKHARRAESQFSLEKLMMNFSHDEI
jgi:hypothetical protein